MELLVDVVLKSRLLETLDEECVFPAVLRSKHTTRHEEANSAMSMSLLVERSRIYILNSTGEMPQMKCGTSWKP